MLFFNSYFTTLNILFVTASTANISSSTIRNIDDLDTSTSTRKISTTQGKILIDDDLHRIVGGRNASVEEYPFIVSIQNINNIHFCGGSILSPKLILTASHCVTRDGVTVLPMGCCSVVAGQSDLYAEELPTSQRVIVKQFIIHPLYDDTITLNDIACGKLMHSLEFTKTVQPIKVPSSRYPGDISEIVQEITVLGWGSMAADLKKRSSRKMLQAVELPVVNHENCSELYTEQKIYTSMLCTMYKEGGKDACQGDSGGPLVSSKDKFMQYGIVSFGDGCAKENMPGINTRVDMFLDFISHVRSGLDFSNNKTNISNSSNSNSLCWIIPFYLLICVRIF